MIAAMKEARRPEQRLPLVAAAGWRCIIYRSGIGKCHKSLLHVSSF